MNNCRRNSAGSAAQRWKRSDFMLPFRVYVQLLLGPGGSRLARAARTSASNASQRISTINSPSATHRCGDAASARCTSRVSRSASAKRSTIAVASNTSAACRADAAPLLQAGRRPIVLPTQPVRFPVPAVAALVVDLHRRPLAALLTLRHCSAPLPWDCPLDLLAWLLAEARRQDGPRVGLGALRLLALQLGALA